MLEAGEDARFVARRLVVHASEDIGMADSQALLVATAAAHAVEFVGLPEARINLAHAVVYLATAPKSNRAYAAYGEAESDARTMGGEVTMHLRDAHYSGARGLGHGVGYQYPHNDPNGWVDQQYLPPEVEGRSYYHPSPHGAEARLQYGRYSSNPPERSADGGGDSDADLVDKQEPTDGSTSESG